MLKPERAEPTLKSASSGQQATGNKEQAKSKDNRTRKQLLNSHNKFDLNNSFFSATLPAAF